MSGIKSGGPSQLPSTNQVGEFADDQLANQKARKKDAKKAQQEARKKAGKKSPAQTVKEVHKTAFTREAQKSKTTKSANKAQATLTQDPKLKPQQHPSYDGQMGKAAGQLGVINQLLSQLSKAIDDADLAASTFLDDKIHARQKGKEDAAKKNAKERNAKDAKDKLLKDSEKVSRGTDAQDSQEKSVDAVKSESMVTSKSLSESSIATPGANYGDSSSGALSWAQGLESAGSTSEELIEALNNKAAALISLGASLDSVMAPTLNAAAEDLRNVAELVEQAHSRFKGLVTPMLFGAFGPLRSEPYDQFKGLFAQVENWPNTIPPHKICKDEGDWTKGDWDQFLQWLLSPQRTPEDLDQVVDALNL